MHLVYSIFYLESMSYVSLVQFVQFGQVIPMTGILRWVVRGQKTGRAHVAVQPGEGARGLCPTPRREPQTMAMISLFLAEQGVSLHSEITILK